MTITPMYVAPRPLLSDFEDLESPDDLARMLLAYCAAYAVEAGLKGKDKRPISITPRTALRLRIRGLATMEVSHEIWPLGMAMWLGVDEAGNAFEYGSEGCATHLSFAYLRKLPVERLKELLESCDPFAEYYKP